MSRTAKSSEITDISQLLGDEQRLSSEQLAVLDAIQKRILWLSTHIIHHANHVRPNSDGIKVGGHQASSASVVSILTALYFHSLRRGDRVSIKPHASPAFHAIQYLLGDSSTRQYLTTLREYRGLQVVPQPHQGPGPGRLLDRLGRAGRGRAAVRRALAPLRARSTSARSPATASSP